MKTTAKKNKTGHIAQAKKDFSNLISVVLLCDNPGYRMKSYGPVSLIDITNKQKLIDIQIEAINTIFKNCEIILCVGFGCDKICKYVKAKCGTNIRIVENQIYTETNSCESLRLCLNNINNDKVIICDGGLLLDHSTMELIDTNSSCVLLESYPNQTLEIGVNTNKDCACFFSFGAKYIWSEIFFLNGKDIIDSLRRIVSQKHNKNKFVFEAINELINMRYKIKTIDNTKPLHKISSIKTYHNIKGAK